MRILVTGGAGYIGSHTCVELINNGHDVIVVDNLANSSAKAIERVEHITNAKIPFYQDDLLDADEISKIFDEHQIDCVIHFVNAAYHFKNVNFALCNHIDKCKEVLAIGVTAAENVELFL